MPHFDQISVKISVLGLLYPNRSPIGVKFGKEEGTFGTLLLAKFHPPIGATCRPCVAKNFKIGL